MSHNSNGAGTVPKVQLAAIMPAATVPLRQAQLAQIAVLCVSGRSIYKHLPGVDAYDERRDARTFSGTCPVVAHPPCRTWSKYLWHMAKPADWQAEQDLGRWCVQTVLKNGGVLEHPAGSKLWADQNLPLPNSPERDPFLYTVYLEQAWFGYKSRKPTWVLVAGVPRCSLPSVPMNLTGNFGNIEFVGKTERSRTVQPLAEWLCQAARAKWWQFSGRRN